MRVALCGLQPEVETMLERVGVEYKEYKSPNHKEF